MLQARTPIVTVVIVGGGPAGLMSAMLLAERNIPVRIYDAMPSIGRKFLLAGRGGLNLTHAGTLGEFAPLYRDWRDRFEHFLNRFSPDDFRAWLSRHGIETKEGTSRRIFPTHFSAGKILGLFVRRLYDLGVTFHLRHRWVGFSSDGSPCFVFVPGDQGHQGDQGDQKEVVPAAATILALGGASYSTTGSDGRWAEILRSKNVLVHPFKPANCGFHAAWSAYFAERHQGVPLKNVVLSFAGRSIPGELLITRYGVEGSTIYALGADLREAFEHDGRSCPTLDLKPGLSLTEIERRVSEASPGRSLSSILRSRLRLSPAACDLLRERLKPETLRNAGLLAQSIKKLELELLQPRSLEEAISSAGGIDGMEVDDNLMLRRLPGVFAAGEMLGWEAPTGGYLLQGAFTTGFIAAQGVLEFLSSSPS
ncbi:MAG: TIGR03862 family flavoprotein [Candidatus Ozemobacteraceae bacterium]